MWRRGGGGGGVERDAALQVLKEMVVAWVLTLPAAGAIAYILAKMAAFTLPVVAYSCYVVTVAGEGQAACGCCSARVLLLPRCVVPSL